MGRKEALGPWHNSSPLSPPIMCHIMHRMAVQDVNQIVCLASIEDTIKQPASALAATKIGKFTNFCALTKEVSFYFWDPWTSCMTRREIIWLCMDEHPSITIYWRKCPIMIFGIDIPVVA